MKDGLNSMRGSMLPNSSLMLAPLRGGRISKEKSVLLEEAM
jgi:hypothetical protein